MTTMHPANTTGIANEVEDRVRYSLLRNLPQGQEFPMTARVYVERDIRLHRTVLELRTTNPSCGVVVEMPIELHNRVWQEEDFDFMARALVGQFRIFMQDNTRGLELTARRVPVQEPAELPELISGSALPVRERLDEIKTPVRIRLRNRLIEAVGSNVEPIELTHTNTGGIYTYHLRCSGLEVNHAMVVLDRAVIEDRGADLISIVTLNLFENFMHQWNLVENRPNLTFLSEAIDKCTEILRDNTKTSEEMKAAMEVFRHTIDAYNVALQQGDPIKKKKQRIIRI